jgi:hypothetical protein
LTRHVPFYRERTYGRSRFVMRLLLSEAHAIGIDDQAKSVS